MTVSHLRSGKWLRLGYEEEDIGWFGGGGKDFPPTKWETVG